MRKGAVIFAGVIMLAVMCCGSAFASYRDEGHSWEDAYVIDPIEDIVELHYTDNTEDESSLSGLCVPQ